MKESRSPAIQFGCDRLASHSDASSERTEQAWRDRISEVCSTDAARHVEVLGPYWLAHSLIRVRVNSLASGRADRDADDRLAELPVQRGGALPIPCPLPGRRAR